MQPPFVWAHSELGPMPNAWPVGRSGPRRGWAEGGTVRPSPLAPAKQNHGYSGRDRASGIACGDPMLQRTSGIRKGDGADKADEAPMAAALWAAERALAKRAATSSQCIEGWWDCQIAHPSN